MLEPKRVLATFTVTTTVDVVDGSDGVLSLREAFDVANTTPNVDALTPDRIEFNIPGDGPHTIQPLSNLPAITDPVVVDGSTQGIVVDGSIAGGTGLSINGGGTTIDSLAIAGFERGIEILGGSGSLIKNVDVSSNMLLPTGEGIYVNNSSGNIIDQITASGRAVGVQFVNSHSNNIVQYSTLAGNVVGISAKNNGLANQYLNNDLSDSSSVALSINGDNQFVVDGNNFDGSSVGLSLGNIDDLHFAPAPGTLDLSRVEGTALQLSDLSNSTFDGLDLSRTGGAVGVGDRGLFVGQFTGSSNITFTNLTIQDRETGIHISKGSDLTFRNVDLTVPSATSPVGTGVIATISERLTFEDFDVRDRVRGVELINGVFDSLLTRIDVTVPSATSAMGEGIYVSNSSGNIIDQITASGRAVGVQFVNTTNNNKVQNGNLVNNLTGIHLGRSTNSEITGNIIASNQGVGVILSDGTGNIIRGNAIFSNGGLGIDLSPTGVTPNDAGDLDTGANGLQNFPIISLAEDGSATHVMGTLNSLPSTEFILDFYANTVADPSGHGEGERYLGSHTVMTDAAGDVSFDVLLAGASTAGEFISATATGPEGTSEFSGIQLVESSNSAPFIESINLSPLAENSAARTFVGQVIANDEDDDSLDYSISDSRFEIDSSGNITVATGAILDFESETSISTTVTVSDPEDATATQDIAIQLLNQASITGTVFVDADEDGLFDANEVGIDGVTVELLDENDNLIAETVTSSGGFYLFDDLDPGTYRLHELQPSGVDDGVEQLGSLGGTIVANDTMQLTLERTDAADYIFAELGQLVSSGDTATIGFWQNKNGQELISQGGNALAEWLSSNFGNVLGNALSGATGGEVVAFYKDQLFKQKAINTAGPAKVDAQFMAVAFATYFTNSSLAGSVASNYGFNISQTGIGTHIVNVGSSGAAFDVDDNSDLTIMQLLLATNSLTDVPDGIEGFAYIYDQNGDGVIDAYEASIRAMANEIYTNINESGDF